MDGWAAARAPGGLGRRAFLSAAAGAAAALAWPGRAEAGAEARRLVMVSTHTDERLDVTYFEAGALRDAALALGGGGVGYYGASDFVHLDTGRVRRW